jgi:predicted dinucleotide-binding enzyme
MTTVGFIGSGNIGGTVARLAVAAGYDVVLSNSRGPQTSRTLFRIWGHGRIPELYDGPLSSSEVLQRHLGTAHVVKVFNNITSWHLRRLARPAGAADRSALPIAGDDPIAKAAVSAFLDAIGYDSVVAGTLGTGGRRVEFGSFAFVAPYGGLSDERGTPVGVAALRAVLGV